MTTENSDLNDIGETSSEYNIDYNRKHDCYLVKCENELVFYDYENCPYITSLLFGNKTICFGQSFLEDAIKDFTIEGNNLIHVAELNNITIANKLDMSYGSYIKHNLHAVERKLNAKINKNEGLVKRLDCGKRQPIINKFSFIPISNT